jgi:hypothetical protein
MPGFAVVSASCPRWDKTRGSVVLVLHGATGGWRIPLVVLLLWLVPETLIALRAARPGQLGTPAFTEVELVRVEPKHLDSAALSRR